MKREEIKEFLETLHFHGYIDHDITKLDNLIDDYYPKQYVKADVAGPACACEGNTGGYRYGENDKTKCSTCGREKQTDL